MSQLSNQRWMPIVSQQSFSTVMRTSSSRWFQHECQSQVPFTVVDGLRLTRISLNPRWRGPDVKLKHLLWGIIGIVLMGAFLWKGQSHCCPSLEIIIDLRIVSDDAAKMQCNFLFLDATLLYPIKCCSCQLKFLIVESKIIDQKILIGTSKEQVNNVKWFGVFPKVVC